MYYIFLLEKGEPSISLYPIYRLEKGEPHEHVQVLELTNILKFQDIYLKKNCLSNFFSWGEF